MNELHKFLADKYLPSITSDQRAEYARAGIRLDKLQARDNPHLVCQVEIMVTGDDEYQLRLSRCPESQNLKAFLRLHQGTVAKRYGKTPVMLQLRIDQILLLRDLSEQIDQIPKEGYCRDHNRKWICRCTAKLLSELADNLTIFLEQRSRICLR